MLAEDSFSEQPKARNTQHPSEMHTGQSPRIPSSTDSRRKNIQLIESLEKRLKQAELIIEVQKKVSQMLGLDLPEGSQNR